mmetsp:Transcript_113932/g.362300  ORF Transcript_113932/g.362300 Transcript_113932/m.362300 type:complete len:208 (+) Transcript_113932:873-1496(+)
MLCMEPLSSTKPRAPKRVISGARPEAVLKYMWTQVWARAWATKSIRSRGVVTFRPPVPGMASSGPRRMPGGSQIPPYTPGSAQSTTPATDTSDMTCTNRPASSEAAAVSSAPPRPALNKDASRSATRTAAASALTCSSRPTRGAGEARPGSARRKVAERSRSRAMEPGKKQARWSILAQLCRKPISRRKSKGPVVSCQVSCQPPWWW